MENLAAGEGHRNQSFVVGVNRVGKMANEINHSGDSMVVDPLGEVLYTKANEEDIHTITLHKENSKSVRHKLPFLEDADTLIIQSRREHRKETLSSKA